MRRRYRFFQGQDRTIRRTTTQTPRAAAIPTPITQPRVADSGKADISASNDCPPQPRLVTLNRFDVTLDQFSTTLVLTTAQAEPTITLVAVASSGLTGFRVAGWAESPQARSAGEYCSGRVRAPRLALAPASRSEEAGGLALD